MVPNLTLAVIVLSVALVGAVIRNRWRFDDGFRAGHHAATLEANRELNDMLNRYNISVNGVITGTDDSPRTRGI